MQQLRMNDGEVKAKQKKRQEKQKLYAKLAAEPDDERNLVRIQYKRII